MAKQHDWQYKSVKSGYWVVCADCGASDKIYSIEEQARKRMIELRTVARSPKLAKLFPKRHF